MASRHAIAERRRCILARCRDQPRSARELAEFEGVSERTIAKDLRALSDRFGDRLQHTNGDGYLWTGAAPHPIPEPPTHIDHYELVALVTARGLLRDPRSERSDGSGYPGLLAGAIDDLLTRVGLHQQADAICPEAITVSRFAALVEEPWILAEAVNALLGGECLIGSYGNLRGDRHDVHLCPVRLVLHQGEWLLLANDGRRAPAIKAYRLARFTALRPVPRPPTGVPPREQLRLAAQRHLDTAFRSTGSSEPGAVTRVVLALAPEAVPHFEARHWGIDQRWIEKPEDLPAGWARLAFSTAGLAHARHELLGHGSAVVVEEPETLREWIGEEARILARRYAEAASKSQGPDGTKSFAGTRQDGTSPRAADEAEAAE